MKILQTFVNMPLPSRLHLFLKAPYLEIMSELFKLIEGIATDSEKISENAYEIQNSLKNTIDKLVNSINDQNDVTDFYLDKRNLLEHLVNVVEVKLH